MDLLNVSSLFIVSHHQKRFNLSSREIDELTILVLLKYVRNNCMRQRIARHLLLQGTALL